jgi:hypothetical protein
MNRRIEVTHWALLLSTLFIAALLYWPSLNGPLTLDHVANLDIFRPLSAQQRLNISNVFADRGSWLGGRPASWLSF